jgi:hypothetical protein
MDLKTDEFEKHSEILNVNDNFVIGYMGLALDENRRFIGVKGVGKDTASELVSDLLVNSHTPINLSLAGALKDIICRYYNISRAEYDTNEKKEEPIKDYPGWTFRKMLEIYGTNVIRQGIIQLLPDIKEDPENLWLNRVRYIILKENMDPTERLVADTFDLSNDECFNIDRNRSIPRLNYSFNELHRALLALMKKWDMPYPKKTYKKLIQITDVRFFNEYQALKKMKALLVQIQRTLNYASVNTHPSNTVDVRMIPDVTIQNNASKDVLKQNLWRILSEPIHVKNH